MFLIAQTNVEKMVKDLFINGPRQNDGCRQSISGAISNYKHANEDIEDIENCYFESAGLGISNCNI